MRWATGRPAARGPKAHVYDAAYTGVPNWDIGRPQRAFVYLAETDLLSDPVLDVGCGTGELALFLARHGHSVLGIDIAPRAIEQARAKARWRRVDAHFLVWDALELDAFVDVGLSFGSVVDSAMFHVFGEEERRRFVDELTRVVRPGGMYFVLGDARPNPRALYGLSPGELRERFRPEARWKVEFVVETVFERRRSRSPAYFAGVRRLGPG